MPERQIDLICLGVLKVHWPLGKVWSCKPAPASIGQVTQDALQHSSAEAFLFWDARLGAVPVDQVLALLRSPDDLWHAGLCLGMRGQPQVIDFVSPTWMLNRDPGQIPAASWRVSLRACLVRTGVLRQVGFIDPGFRTLEAAGLEWGHRCLWQGIFCRHEPGLVNNSREYPVSLPAGDELRFAWLRFGRRWALWVLIRAVLRGCWTLPQALHAWQAGTQNRPAFGHTPYQRSGCIASRPVYMPVSVLVPTVDRYPYLRTLLEQLRGQTVPAAEIIIIDQTPLSQRKPELYAGFTDLPIHVLYQETAGQCSSRNTGLQAACGEMILFIDDDDEIPPDLIEKHLASLQRFEADVSSGVAHEVGAGPLPESFTFLRTSDVFPTNNSMVRRSALQDSGLFDLAYDHGARADADLGMRLYLSGARMVLDPQIAVLHHHAPQGGLRLHKARVITYASSRKRLTHRSLPSATEIYLARRYFTDRQQAELKWLSVFTTFSLHDPSRVRRLLKLLVSLLLLLDTLLRLGHREREAEALASIHPTIAQLEAESQEI